MTERINGQGFRPVDTSGARRTEGAKAGAGQGASATEASAPQVGETVNITRSALLLAKLEEVVRSTPAVDSAARRRDQGRGRCGHLRDRRSVGRGQHDPARPRARVIAMSEMSTSLVAILNEQISCAQEMLATLGRENQALVDGDADSLNAAGAREGSAGRGARLARARAAILERRDRPHVRCGER